MVVGVMTISDREVVMLAIDRIASGSVDPRDAMSHAVNIVYGRDGNGDEAFQRLMDLEASIAGPARISRLNADQRVLRFRQMLDADDEIRAKAERKAAGR